jgi:hypothetical protein
MFRTPAGAPDTASAGMDHADDPHCPDLTSPGYIP